MINVQLALNFCVAPVICRLLVEWNLVKVFCLGTAAHPDGSLIPHIFSPQVSCSQNQSYTVGQYFIRAGQNNNSLRSRSHGTFAPQCYTSASVTRPTPLPLLQLTSHVHRELVSSRGGLRVLVLYHRQHPCRQNNEILRKQCDIPPVIGLG